MSRNEKWSLSILMVGLQVFVTACALNEDEVLSFVLAVCAVALIFSAWLMKGEEK